MFPVASATPAATLQLPAKIVQAKSERVVPKKCFNQHLAPAGKFAVFLFCIMLMKLFWEMLKGQRWAPSPANAQNTQGLERYIGKIAENRKV